MASGNTTRPTESVGKDFFFFFYKEKTWQKNEEVVRSSSSSKERRSRKKFEKSVEWTTRKFEILSDVRLSLPSHLLSQYVTTLPVPHFYYYKYIGAFVVLKSQTYFLVITIL